MFCDESSILRDVRRRARTSNKRSMKRCQVRSASFKFIEVTHRPVKIHGHPEQQARDSIRPSSRCVITLECRTEYHETTRVAFDRAVFNCPTPWLVLACCALDVGVLSHDTRHPKLTAFGLRSCRGYLRVVLPLLAQIFKDGRTGK